MEVTLQPPKVVEYLEEDGSGRVELSATWTVSSQYARRKVNGQVASRIGLLISREPSLVIGERVVWRVPLVLALKDVGDLGVAGMVDVDANTGEVLVTDDLIKDMTERAALLAKRAVAVAA